MNKFKIHANFKPSGSQPEAIEQLTRGILENRKHQVLLGVTGSGKTFTMANVIERVQRPALILSHNKTLAAQLCAEFRDFFPENAVEFFVSYYDYYQPEAYVPAQDLYIEKDSSINDEIDKLRHSATSALNERRDVIVGGLRILHLRHRRSGAIPENEHFAPARHEDGQGCAPKKAGRHTVPAETTWPSSAGISA